MRIALVGAVESTLCAMRALTDSGQPPVLVATLREDLAGRHSDFVDLAPYAAGHDIALTRVRNINDDDAIAAMRAASPDYIFVIGWSQICRDEFMDIAPGKVIGYHPAPLPRMRGRAVLPWTILNDEKITGATLFWMDQGVDTGDILAQRFFHVAPRETARTLYDKHMAALDAMVRDCLAELGSNAPRRDPQDEECATYAARRRPADGRIDWTRPAEEIDRLVRSVSHPYPGAYAPVEGGRMIVWKARAISNTRHHGVVGQIVAMDEDAIEIVAGDGLLRIEDWEIDGDRRPRLHSVLDRS